MSSRRAWKELLLFAGELAALFGGLWLGLAIRHLDIPAFALFMEHLPAFGVLFLLWQGVFLALGMYELNRLRDLPFQVGSLATALGVNWVVGVTYFYFGYAVIGYTPRAHFLLAVVFGHLAVLGWRRVAYRLFRTRLMRQRVLILGHARDVAELAEELIRQPQLGFVPVGSIQEGVDLIAAEPRWVERHWPQARDAVGEAVRRRLPVVSLPAFYEQVFGKVDPVHAASAGWLFSAVLSRSGRMSLIVKRCVDAVIAAVLLVALAPLLVLVALAVRLADGSPVFFGQRRVGFMGREFTMWKFRTMAVQADDGTPFTSDAAAAGLVTRLGRWLRRSRLDELPQLWLVLRGDMALVGPRPEWHREVEQIEALIPHYQIRHLVRPGITGWAQLNYRATKDPKDSLEKFRYDLYYLKNRSPALDLAILLRTARRVAMGDSSRHAIIQRPDFRLPRASVEFAGGVSAMMGREPARQLAMTRS